jgi:hypothetical protein
MNIIMGARPCNKYYPDGSGTGRQLTSLCCIDVPLCRPLRSAGAGVAAVCFCINNKHHQPHTQYIIWTCKTQLCVLLHHCSRGLPLKSVLIYLESSRAASYS